MSTKLDRNQPFGTITGHPWARYVQGDRLFNEQGLAEDDEPAASPKQAAKKTKQTEDAPVAEFGLALAERFLRDQLSGGPVAKSDIFRECESQGLAWEDVDKAFKAMGGRTSKKKNVMLWQLPEE